MARPLHLTPEAIGLVLLGGVLGAPARYAVVLALPRPAGHWPTATLLVNLLGAFALGLLLESLERSGPDTGGRRRLRLLVGTGFLGAFTTASTLALDADLLVREHAPGLAAAYAVTSLVGGVVATLAGLALAGRSSRPLPADPDAP